MRSTVAERAVITAAAFTLALASHGATAQKIDIQAVKGAAAQIASKHYAICNGKLYTITKKGLLSEHSGKPKLELLTPGGLGPNFPLGVTDTDILNGLLWRGTATFSLGGSARDIDQDGVAGQWRPSHPGLGFYFTYQDKTWVVLDDEVTSGFWGSLRNIAPNLSCDIVQEKLKNSK